MPTVAQAFKTALAKASPDAGAAIEAIPVKEDASPDAERDRAFKLVELAVSQWLGDLLRDAAGRHPDQLGGAAAKLDEFRSISSADNAREAGTFAHGIADLANQASEARLRFVALATAKAGDAAGEEDWEMAGAQAGEALAFYSPPLKLLLDFEIALREIGALVEDQD
jgi:hypothetical protein